MTEAINDVFAIIGRSAIVAAALDHGVLEELVSGTAATIDELASKLSLDSRALALALDVLVAHGLAERRGNAFAAPADLVESISRGPGGAAQLSGLWRHAGRFLETGEPFVRMDAAPADREAAYKNVVGGLGRMFEPAARQLASWVLERTKPPARLLDVGCGSGVWSLSIARAVPNARVTGLDLPSVLTVFEEKARELGLEGRIARIPGDMHAVEIPERSFDLAVIANVLRLEQPASAATLVRRVSGALDAGGALIVVDALGGGTREKEIGRTVYAYHLGMRTSGGRVHPPDEVKGWLRDAGLSSIEAVDLEGQAGGHGALIARR
jgi:SAM-dependent methyltransferase